LVADGESVVDIAAGGPVVFALDGDPVISGESGGPDSD
jgi:hypothetical protein